MIKIKVLQSHIMRELLLISAICVMISCSVQSQTAGVKFEHGFSWNQIKAKAKKENKFILVDCFATWCGPCKFMSQRIFTQPEVGEFINRNFVSVAVQMDKTNTDDKVIKDWYNDAELLAEQYSVKEFPTYLFFSPEGRVVHRIIGSTGDEWIEFVKKAGQALDSNSQYYTRVESFRNHLYDSIYLKKILIEALESEDVISAAAIGNAYFVALKNPYYVDNVKLFSKAIISSNDTGFRFLCKNYDSLSKLLEKDFIEYVLANIIAKEEIDPVFVIPRLPMIWSNLIANIKNRYPIFPPSVNNILFQHFLNNVYKYEIYQQIYTPATQEVNWDAVSLKIKSDFPGVDPSEMIAQDKPKYYKYKQLWPEYGVAVIAYFKEYGGHIRVGVRNTLLWDIFLHISDQKILNEAVFWSHATIPSPDDDQYHSSGTYINMDTYANLLYKTGKIEEAIGWEEKALSLAKDGGYDLTTIRTDSITLERMKKGESTWEGRDSRGDYL